MVKKINTVAWGLPLLLAALWMGCKPDPSFDPPLETESVAPVSFSVPPGWPQPIYTFQNNELTQNGFELGRQLFYETRLSRDNAVSCGTCHQQHAAFANLDHPTSHGVDGLFGKRNAPPLFNLNWHPAYFWDGREPNLENFPIHPITDRVEMDETIDNIVGKLSADARYKLLFKNAFGTETITQQRIFKAIAQFQAAMVSSNSRYDKYIRGEAGGTLTESELNGLNIFRQKCESCHKEPIFSDFSYRNNGLPPTAVNDSGRASFTRKAEDMYKFKVPSLRNINLSRQYMHDGRFDNLQQVLNHYAGAKFASPTLDTLFTQSFTLTENEKTDIFNFLLTLTDNDFISDKRFSEPVK